MNTFINEFGAVITTFCGTTGTLNQFDIAEIIQCAKGAEVYVETGSYLGLSSLVVAKHSNALVYAHDIWVSDWNELKGSPPAEHKDYFYTFYKMVRDNGFQSRIIPIRGDSKYTLGIHEDESIDVCFVDGDHSYEGCLGDLEAAYPKMKRGTGVILIHDCCTNTDETTKAVRAFVLKYNLTIDIISHSCGMIKIYIPKHE